jgi:SET domain-containing protein
MGKALNPNVSSNPIAETALVRCERSAIHGVGGFAKQNLPGGTPIIEYVGEKIAKEQSLKRCEQNNEYIFTLDEQHDLDGNVDWNPARFINHSCAPNSEADVRDGRIWIVAACDIRAGEEITFNYGFDLEDYRNYPCYCGSSNCVGFIVAEEFFEHVRAQRQWAQNS